MREPGMRWLYLSAALLTLICACTDPDLASGLVTEGPPTVSAVTVTGEAGTEATYCNPAMAEHTPKVCLAGQSVEPVRDVRPLGWKARVVFKELLDPSIEDIDTAGTGSIARAHPFTVTCGDAVIAYDGFYDPSGNHDTSPVGPALVIYPASQPAAASASSCRIAIDAGAIRDKDGEPAPNDIRFAFTLAALHVAATTPAAGATDADPLGQIRLSLNSHVDAATLAGHVQLIDASGLPVAAAITVPAADPTSIAIEPAAALAHGAAYTVTLSTGITDTFGGALARPAVLAFTTAP
jgi:hypothetical protein